MTSRTQVAHYLADRLKSDRKGAIQQAAAWLVDTRRAGETSYMAADVARYLGDQGYVLIKAVSSRPLSATARQEIEDYVRRVTNAHMVELTTVIDPTLIGGIRIELPDRELDASVQHRLRKFVEGASL